MQLLNGELTQLLTLVASSTKQMRAIIFCDCLDFQVWGSNSSCESECLYIQRGPRSEFFADVCFQRVVVKSVCSTNAGMAEGLKMGEGKLQCGEYNLSPRLR